MRVLYDFCCPNCGLIAEFAERGGEGERGPQSATCSACGAEAERRFSAPILDRDGTMRAAMVAHTPDRRVSKAVADHHEHWQRTRYGEQAGKIENLNAKFKPTYVG